MAAYNLILIPERSIVPDELQIPKATGNNIIERISSSAEGPVLFEATARELQFLVEYRDLLDVEIAAVIGLSGAMYSTIWNTYVSTMKRVTIDSLLAEQQEQLNARADAGQRVDSTPELRTRAARARDIAPDDDESIGEIS